MATYEREVATVLDITPGGDTVKSAAEKLDAAIDDIYGDLNTIDAAQIALGETNATAYRGDRGKTAYDHSQTAHAPAGAQANADILKAEIEAKLTGSISSHTHPDATTSTAGFFTAAQATKLDGIATGATAYTHPTTDGNLHVPATSTTNNGKFLQAGATAGALAWATLDFTASKGTNGYQKLPSGLILQWGTKTSIPATSSAGVTFPLQFPSSVYCIMATRKNSAYSAQGVVVYPDNVAQFTIYNSSSSSADAYWVAIGE